MNRLPAYLFYDTIECHKESRVVSRLTIAETLRQDYRADRRSARSWSPAKSAAEIKDSTISKALPAHAWPGGYDMAFYVWERGQLTGDVLCATCARTAVIEHSAVVHPHCEDGYEGDGLNCDDCGTEICAPSINSAIDSQHTWGLADDGTMSTVLTCKECGHTETFSDRDGACSFLWAGDGCPICDGDTSADGGY